MAEFTTVEEARAEIIRLQEELEVRTTERDALSQDNSTLTEELARVRTINQQYFNKLSAQTSDKRDEKDEEEEEVPSCEEFALTLKY